MNAIELLAVLRDWRARGWLRALDLALAGFLHELDTQAPPGGLLAAALLTHLEGRGHSCLPLQDVLRDPQDVLGWPPEAATALTEALSLLPRDGPAAAAAWGGWSALQIDPPDGRGATPLVLAGARLYLRRLWRSESQVADQVVARARPGDDDAGLDRARARVLIDRLFEPTPTGAAASASESGTDWQKVACAIALRARLSVITGGPGTGKTHTAARLLVLLQALHRGPQPLRVALAAPTGKAAARLRQSIGSALGDLLPRIGDDPSLADWAARLGPARTLHALLGTQPGTRRFAHDAANPVEVDVLFVDEASMVHLEMMAALLEALPVATRVVLLGDRDQLASVEAGAVLGDLCGDIPAASGTAGYRADTVAWIDALTGQALPPSDRGAEGALSQQTVVLRRSRRFTGPIAGLAQAVNAGDGAEALKRLRATPHGDVALLEGPAAQSVARLAVDGRPVAAGVAGGYRTYLEHLARRPTEAGGFDDWVREVLRRFDACRVLCAVREGPWGVTGLNLQIERALVERGLLQRPGEWFEGRPVMVTRNDPALGVFNGDIGVVIRPPAAGPLRAYFLDGDAVRSVSVARLADVQTAFALTVHKSQGSEFEHVLLVLPEDDAAVLTRELLYTGITRARAALTVVAPLADRVATACGRRTRRLSGLGAMLRGH